MADNVSGEDRADGRAQAGQALYTGVLLAGYDAVVLGLSNRWIWRCPTSLPLQQYDANVSDAHLEVGVGSGYFLDHCRFPVPQPALTLFDLQENPLQVTARRVRRYRPITLRGDVLRPVPLAPGSFSSIGINYVLHCLPGTIHSKGTAFDHLAPLLRPGGVIFGSTLLYGGVQHSAPARALMGLYNRMSIFTNLEDDLDGLHEVLAARFSDYRVEVQGSAALFTARV